MYLRYYLFTMLVGLFLTEAPMSEVFGFQLNKGDNMCLSDKSVRNIDRYKNSLTSMSSFIKLKIKDVKTGKLINLVIENILFADYLATEQGMIRDRAGRFKDSEASIKFKKNTYVDFMLKNDDKPIEINLERFKTFIGNEYLRTHVFTTSLSLQQLNVIDEKEFITKYFDFKCSEGEGILKGKYYNEYGNNPLFIALLIELGYDVLSGDISPNLNIYTKPFIKLFGEDIKK